MDVIVRLSNPPACVVDPDSLHLQFEFQKTRDLLPSQASGLHLEYRLIDGCPVWLHRRLRDARADWIKRLASRIQTKSVVAQMLGCDLWEVGEALNQSEPVRGWNDEF